MATNEPELYEQPNIVRRTMNRAARALKDYSLPLGALLAGVAVNVVPEPHTAVVVVFIVLAVIEYER